MMLLPQTTAFTKLSKRLECVNSLCMIQMTGQKSLEEENSKEDKSLEEELLQHFKTMQSKFRTINEIETD